MVNSNNWFETWFDSPYYHLLYGNRSQEEAQLFITNLIQYLSPPKDSKILDIACGKGRHALALANMHFDVTGIDLSSNSITEAKKLTKNNLHFDIHDMRHPYKKNTFDYVFNCFTSFGYFDNDGNQACISAFAENLKQKGILVIDFMNCEKAISNLVAKEIIQKGDITFNISRIYSSGVIQKTIQFKDSNKQMHTFTENVQAITLNKFETYLNHCNLKIINTFGDYNLSEFEHNNSDRLIIIAQKN